MIEYDTKMFLPWAEASLSEADYQIPAFELFEARLLCTRITLYYHHAILLQHRKSEREIEEMKIRFRLIRKCSESYMEAIPQKCEETSFCGTERIGRGCGMNKKKKINKKVSDFRGSYTG